MPQPPAPDDGPRPEIRPNTLSDPARPTSGRPVTNRLARMREVGARARLPGVSGRWSAALLLVLFVAVAVMLPLALHRSAWVEAEIIVGAWFLIWTAVLTWLGYTGRAVDQDWAPFRSPRRTRGATGGSWSSVDFSLPSFDVGDGDAGLACLLITVVIAWVVVLVLLVTFTIGYVVPLVAIGLYTLVRAMLNHVAARGHVTRGNLALSLARGAIWAAVYTAPLAIAIWLLHVTF